MWQLNTPPKRARNATVRFAPGALVFTSLLAVSLFTSPADGTRHHYEYIAGLISFDQARFDAQATAFQGVQGHLVTISHTAENEFVKAFGAGWIGLTDATGFISPLDGFDYDLIGLGFAADCDVVRIGTVDYSGT